MLVRAGLPASTRGGTEPCGSNEAQRLTGRPLAAVELHEVDDGAGVEGLAHAPDRIQDTRDHSASVRPVTQPRVATIARGLCGRQSDYALPPATRAGLAPATGDAVRQSNGRQPLGIHGCDGAP